MQFDENLVCPLVSAVGSQHFLYVILAAFHVGDCNAEDKTNVPLPDLI